MAHIVIYEANDLMRGLLREWLSDAGYRVSALTPEEAPSAGRADLVIASLYRPRQNGAELVHDIQAAHPGAPVIALSAQFRSGLSAIGSTARALGVEHVIAKPLLRADLLGAVCAILSSQRGAPGR